MNREIGPAYYRPKERRLIDLTNTELSLLFAKRAEDIRSKLKGHIWWDSSFITYWNKFLDLQDVLYEIMLEIQSRYPEHEIKSYHRILPAVEPRSPY